MDKIEEVRKILGTAVSDLTDEDLSEEVTKFELLAECILNLAEKEIFKDKTLSEMLSDFFSQKETLSSE